jgi:hypothetical protein
MTYKQTNNNYLIQTMLLKTKISIPKIIAFIILFL